MDKNITDIPQHEVEHNVLAYKDLIIEGIKSTDTRTKTVCLYYMILFPLVFRPFIGKLLDNGTKLEHEYIAELIQNNLEQYKTELSRLAHDSEPDVRIAALRSYGIDVSLYKNIFIEALKDEHRDIKILALRYLSQFFDELKDTYYSFVSHSDAELAMTATSIILDQRSTSPETIESLLDKANLNAKSLILRHMCDRYEEYKQSINKLLSSDDESLVLELVHRLSRHQFEELKDKLEELLMKPENYRLSSTILYKFGETPSKYKSSIIKALTHENPQIRQSAVFQIKSRPFEYKGELSDVYEYGVQTLKEDLAVLFGQDVRNFTDEALKLLHSRNEQAIKKFLMNLFEDTDEIHSALLELLKDSDKNIKRLVIDYIAKHIDDFDSDMGTIINEIFSKLNKDEKINIFKSIAYHMK